MPGRNMPGRGAASLAQGSLAGPWLSRACCWCRIDPVATQGRTTCLPPLPGQETPNSLLRPLDQGGLTQSLQGRFAGRVSAPRALYVSLCSQGQVCGHFSRQSIRFSVVAMTAPPPPKVQNYRDFLNWGFSHLAAHLNRLRYSENTPISASQILQICISRAGNLFWSLYSRFGCRQPTLGAWGEAAALLGTGSEWPPGTFLHGACEHVMQVGKPFSQRQWFSPEE